MSKIEIVKLQKSYTDRKKNTTVALYDCSLTVNDGEFLVLLGESGCGKTSLLRVIAGVESYDFGAYFLTASTERSLINATRIFPTSAKTMRCFRTKPCTKISPCRFSQTSIHATKYANE